jgi:hypothetical protein
MANVDGAAPDAQNDNPMINLYSRIEVEALPFPDMRIVLQDRTFTTDGRVAVQALFTQDTGFMWARLPMFGAQLPEALMRPLPADLQRQAPALLYRGAFATLSSLPLCKQQTCGPPDAHDAFDEQDTFFHWTAFPVVVRRPSASRTGVNRLRPYQIPTAQLAPTFYTVVPFACIYTSEYIDYNSAPSAIQGVNADQHRTLFMKQFRTSRGAEITVDTQFFAGSSAASSITAALNTANVSVRGPANRPAFLYFFPMVNGGEWAALREQVPGGFRVGGSSMGAAVFGAINGFPSVMYTGYVNTLIPNTRLTSPNFQANNPNPPYGYYQNIGALPGVPHSYNFAEQVHDLNVKVTAAIQRGYPLVIPYHSNMGRPVSELFARQDWRASHALLMNARNFLSMAVIENGIRWNGANDDGQGRVLIGLGNTMTEFAVIASHLSVYAYNFGDIENFSEVGGPGMIARSRNLGVGSMDALAQRRWIQQLPDRVERNRMFEAGAPLPAIADAMAQRRFQRGEQRAAQTIAERTQRAQARNQAMVARINQRTQDQQVMRQDRTSNAAQEIRRRKRARKEAVPRRVALTQLRGPLGRLTLTKAQARAANAAVPRSARARQQQAARLHSIFGEGNVPRPTRRGATLNPFVRYAPLPTDGAAAPAMAGPTADVPPAAVWSNLRQQVPEPLSYDPGEREEELRQQADREEERRQDAIRRDEQARAAGDDVDDGGAAAAAARAAQARADAARAATMALPPGERGVMRLMRGRGRGGGSATTRSMPPTRAASVQQALQSGNETAIQAAEQLIADSEQATGSNRLAGGGRGGFASGGASASGRFGGRGSGGRASASGLFETIGSVVGGAADNLLSHI